MLLKRRCFRCSSFRSWAISSKYLPRHRQLLRPYSNQTATHSAIAPQMSSKYRPARSLCMQTRVSITMFVFAMLSESSFASFLFFPFFYGRDRVRGRNCTTETVYEPRAVQRQPRRFWLASRRRVHRKLRRCWRLGDRC